MKVTPAFFWIVTAVLAASCASGPQLEKYPRAKIDRPFTLPLGVATWETIAVTGVWKDQTSSVVLPPIPAPVFWNTALSDTWTLHWVPLPLALSHQFSYSREQVWGISFGSGAGYASTTGLRLTPMIVGYQRIRIGENLAWETVPAFDATLYTNGSLPSEWSGRLSTGPLFQLSEVFSLGPKVGFQMAVGNTNVVVGDLSVLTTVSSNFTVPVSLNALWSFHRQWDLDVTYNLNGLGRSDGYLANYLWLELRHYW